MHDLVKNGYLAKDFTSSRNVGQPTKGQAYSICANGDISNRPLSLLLVVKGLHSYCEMPLGFDGKANDHTMTSMA